MKISTGKSPDVEDLLSPGDLVSYTCGSEKFSPRKTFSVCEIGSITVETRVRTRPDGTSETAGEAYARARRVAHQMFEAEFELKRKEFFGRLEEFDTRDGK